MSEQHAWFKSYPAFVPQTVDNNKYESLAKVFDDVVSRYGDKVAFQNMDKTMTFNELKVLCTTYKYTVKEILIIL